MGDAIIYERIIAKINNYYTEEKRLILIVLIQQQCEEGNRTRRLLKLAMNDEQASHLKSSYIKLLRAFVTFATKHTKRITSVLNMLWKILYKKRNLQMQAPLTRLFVKLTIW